MNIVSLGFSMEEIMNFLCVQRDTRIRPILKAILQRNKDVSIRIQEKGNGTLHLTNLSHAKRVAGNLTIRGLPGQATIPQTAMDTLDHASRSKGTSGVPLQYNISSP